MSYFTDKLLRFMGYMIIFTMILVVVAAVYIAYTLMFSGSSFKQNDTNSRALMDQNINIDLNEKNKLNEKNSGNLIHSNTPEIVPTYESPESQIPSYSTYNPFEDDSIPIVEPDAIQSTNDFSSPTNQESAPKSNSKPIDPTNKTQQPDLDLLF